MIFSQGLYDWTGWQACKVHQVEQAPVVWWEMCASNPTQLKICFKEWVGDGWRLQGHMVVLAEIAAKSWRLKGFVITSQASIRTGSHMQRHSFASFASLPFVALVACKRTITYFVHKRPFCAKLQHQSTMFARPKSEPLEQSNIISIIWIICKSSAVENLAGDGLQLYPRMPINCRPLPRLWAHSPLWPESWKWWSFLFIQGSGPQ